MTSYDPPPPATDLALLGAAVQAGALAAEGPLVARLAAAAALDAAARAAVAERAAALVRRLRAEARPGLMEAFLAEYGLSTDEGVALMCLAEALLRVPDAPTIDALIEDKLAPGDWARHLGRSASPLVNASTWALMLTGRMLDEGGDGIAARLRGALRRLGEPVIRAAVARAIREMGRQFVLGRTIAEAMARAADDEARGVTFSYDMLGEAARTDADARAYLDAYAGAIRAVARRGGGGIAAAPGISVKLSALHPRFEEAQAARIRAELAPRLLELCRLAAGAGIGLNIDAEEQDRLALTLDLVEAVARDPSLSGWDGLGVVVQAYGRRAGAVLDWLDALAAATGRRLMVRLVKGAYWDSEIKRAQVEGLPDFPVFTAKPATDVSYLGLARRLIGRADRLYPQFATHNAHSAAAVLHMARAAGLSPLAWEFQRLHGMGEALHRMLRAEEGTRLRVYAPVGAHRDLLAYLVRRLLENGANSSFVNQVVDESVAPEAVAADPFAAPPPRRALATGARLFLPRRNSRGRDLADRPTLALLDAARAPWREAVWDAAPLLADGAGPDAGAARTRDEPATGLPLGAMREADPATVARAVAGARPWDAPVAERAATLRRASDIFEDHEGESLALLAREAGKTLPDAVAELREAVDFLRYYADEAERLGAPAAAGAWACISPWNFPLAIFAGQIAAALAMGHAVLAKPAPQTPLIAHRAVEWLHAAGVPRAALQLLPGGAATGAALTGDPRLTGVAFTGSTATALAIRRAMAASGGAPGRPLIAETGGVNAMAVDSTALPEQAVRDIIASAFRSAGQRCSALRLLYLQEEVAEPVLRMLTGAMAELALGDPWDLATDIGPVIDAEARARILAHLARARAEGRLLAQGPAPARGHFVAPAVIRVDGIMGLPEIFGPVLHVATFPSGGLDAVIDAVNAAGHGLTFGLHSRIDDRVQAAAARLCVGNLYVNRNQIGAVVGSQPFGGEGLSGTGPKAGGPHYLPRFAAMPRHAEGAWARAEDPADLTRRLAGAAAEPGHPPPPRAMPGPTGESNRLSLYPRAPLLCLGPGPEAATAQAAAVRALGGRAVAAQGALPAEALATLAPLGGVLWWGEAEEGRALEAALAARDGPLLPLIVGAPDLAHAHHERHTCVDTTAAGGNASLLSGAAGGGA